MKKYLTLFHALLTLLSAAFGGRGESQAVSIMGARAYAKPGLLPWRAQPISLLVHALFLSAIIRILRKRGGVL